MIRYNIFSFLIGLSLLVGLSSSAFGQAKELERSEFISFDIREQAQDDLRDQTQYFLPLTPQYASQNNINYYIVQTDIPAMWLDREIFLHFDGVPSFSVFVNDKNVGSGTDSYGGAEFFVSPYISDGLNTIRIEYAKDKLIDQFEFKGENALFELDNMYIYSQPKLRIADYIVETKMDTLDFTLSMLDLKIVVANSYNSTEEISIGYDIYSPNGKLEYYNLTDIEIAGNSQDTVCFSDKISNATSNLWSAEDPKLYKTTIYVRRKGRMTEYISFHTAFTDLVYDSEGLVLNGERLELSAVNYNSAKTKDETYSQLRSLKSNKFNTLCPDYPQPYWFYDLCEQLGFYVFDQANLNCSKGRDNRRVGGTPTNDPAFLDLYLERTKALYDRNKNRACVVAWSLGGNVGNGFNMYRSYKQLKELDPLRAVVYRDAQGEWNSDISYPSVK